MEEATARNPPTLLTLPGEIRSIIFEFALTSRSRYLILELRRSEVGTPKINHSPPDNTNNTTMAMSIFRACRNIYRECEGNIRALNQLYWSSGLLPLRVLEGRASTAEGINMAENQTFPLALLRTCRQIYRECILDIWGLHRIRFGSRLLQELSIKARQNKLPSIIPFTLIQDLELPFKVYYTPTPSTRPNALFSNIPRWARKGNLRNLTFKIDVDWAPDAAIYDEGRSKRELLHTCLWLHSAALRWDQLMPQVQKRLLLTPSVCHFTLTVLGTMEKFENAICALHLSFGGELWTGDKMAWKDGVRTKHRIHLS